MKKTLILVVDRDDDFGAKAGVESPVVGYDGCVRAAVALGIADPEDSDTNALLAALKLYRELPEENPDAEFEVALICGYEKVGYKSDTVLVEQLQKVLQKVNPDSVVLVGDGAEDEYIYPIITSRVSIDSVKKVYVKQAPGVEGTLYIVKRMLEDPQKRERFIAPISWVLMIICAIYLVANVFTANSLKGFVAGSTTIFIFFVVGLLMMFYAYNLDERIAGSIQRWQNRARRGSIMTVFVVASALLILVGIVMGIYNISEIYTERDTQRILLFLVYSVWFFIFALMLYVFGAIIDGYLQSSTLRYTYITLILNLVSVGLVISGVLDYLLDYVDLFPTNFFVCIIEIVSGFMLAIAATVLQAKIKKEYTALNTTEGESEDGIC